LFDSVCILQKAHAMQSRTDLGWLMTTLLAAIAAPVACGGSTTEGAGAGAVADTAGSGGDGGAASSGGNGGTTDSDGSAGTAGSLGSGGTAGTVGSGGTAGSVGSGGTAGSVGGGGTGGIPPERPACTPVASNWYGGFEECAEGYVHRARVDECPARGPACDPASMDTSQCSQDADCLGPPGGACLADAESNSCYCAFSCRHDAGCVEERVCKCTGQKGAIGGYCMVATCHSDADCSGGRCAVVSTGCNGEALACVFPRQPADTCAADSDCGPGFFCLARSGAPRTCASAGCGGGRPFLVDGAPRLPSSITRSDWTVRNIAPSLRNLDPALRARLAAAWTEAGQMEHASIAAFARFVLELLAFGAPADLVEHAHAAIADETRHAKLCFGIAGAYSGRAIGPGALPMNGVTVAPDLASSVLTAFIEGCIGETVAAAEAAEAAASTTDPAIAAVLTAIAEDEARHAALAWRFVAWALASMPASKRPASALTSTIEHALGSPLPATPDDRDLAPFGLLSGRRRAALRREVLTSVVRPCLHALAQRLEGDKTVRGTIAPSHITRAL
jgi:hypothetical protein